MAAFVTDFSRWFRCTGNDFKLSQCQCGVLFCLGGGGGDMCSPFRSAQGLRVSLWTKLHSALPPLSLPPHPLPPPPPVVFSRLLCLRPVSLDLSPPMLSLRQLSISAFSCPSLLLSSHPPPSVVTSSPRGHVAHLGDDEDEDDDGADDDETHTQ